MVIIISASLFSMFLAYLNKYVKIKQSKITVFGLVFILLTILQVIHYDFGTDYMGYYNDYMLYNGRSINYLKYLYYAGSGAFKDIGWVAINWIMPGENGFYLLVGIISIIQNAIYYKFITTYLDSRKWWEALGIYLFMTSYYVLNFSAIRQGFAVSLCVLSIMLVSKDKMKLSIIVAVIAATIHVSALVILPFIIMSKLPLKNGRKYGVIILVITAVLFLGNTLARNLFDRLIGMIPILERNYGHYVTDIQTSESFLGFGFLLNSVMYLILLFHVVMRFEEYNHSEKVIILLTCISFCILPFQMRITGLVSRVGTYFSVFQIAAVPLVYSKIKDRIIKMGAAFIYIFMMLYEYYEFFFVTKWSAEGFATFHTIFSVLFK